MSVSNLLLLGRGRTVSFSKIIVPSFATVTNQFKGRNKTKTHTCPVKHAPLRPRPFLVITTLYRSPFVRSMMI